MTCTKPIEVDYEPHKSVTQVRFCKTVLVSGGFNILEHEPEEKAERIMEFLIMRKS